MLEFWITVFIGVLSNIATGLLLATVFETLQRRRDLQKQLGELWLLATRASEAVNHSMLRKDGGAEAYARWSALQDEWLRARHSLNFALAPEKRVQLEDSISAIYELHILNSDKRNRKFLRRHVITLPGGAAGAEDGARDTESTDGAPPPTETAERVDYGVYALHNHLHDEKAAYDEFLRYREQLNARVDALLHFDPFSDPGINAQADSQAAQSLPDELAQTWHFGYLYSRVWKWFFSEIYYSFSRLFR
jgi:hypothetical protein